MANVPIALVHWYSLLFCYSGGRIPGHHRKHGPRNPSCIFMRVIYRKADFRFNLENVQPDGQNYMAVHQVL